MRIEHIAIWVKELEVLKDFYVKYFDASSNHKYRNEEKTFESYFLSFKDGGRLEIMGMKGILPRHNPLTHHYGYCHIAFSVGSKSKVSNLTTKLKQDGYTIINEPRMTGDGYFESVVLDPEGNRIEITI